MSLSANKLKILFWSLNALLGIVLIVDIATPKSSGGFDAAVIVLTAITTLLALNRQLPLQNVLPAMLVAAIIGSLAHGLSSNPNFSLPFGPLVFNPASGDKLFNFVPWTIPFLWIVIIFNARGTARLVLRPWRKVKNYGFWLIGLTAIFAMAFDVALEPFAWHVKHFWLWQPTRIAVSWQGTTLLNFVGWLFVSLLILLIATPSLIRKQPGSSGAPDIHPLIIWLAALILFASGSAAIGLWWAAGVDVTIAAVTTVFAVRGVKW